MPDYLFCDIAAVHDLANIPDDSDLAIGCRHAALTFGH